MPHRESRDVNNKEIVGQATNIITAKLLKGGIENNKNSVFSPIGLAAILAILGEGANDDTNYDISTLLKHPDNRGLVRTSYRSVLSHLQGSDPHVAPQFRNWFYVYKNNTIDESYKNMLINDYFVTVRDIEPYNPDDFAIPSTTTTTSESTLLEENIELSDVQLNSKSVANNNSKDIIEFDAFKKESDPVDETRIDNQKDASKFDEVVEDRQYVEAPESQDEMVTGVKQSTNSVAVDDTKASVEEVKVVKPKSKESKDYDSVEKISLPLKKFEEWEIMHAEETRLGKRVNIAY